MISPGNGEEGEDDEARASTTHAVQNGEGKHQQRQHVSTTRSLNRQKIIYQRENNASEVPCSK